MIDREVRKEFMVDGKGVYFLGLIKSYNAATRCVSAPRIGPTRSRRKAPLRPQRAADAPAHRARADGTRSSTKTATARRRRTRRL
jgi:hypothetical protein